MEKQARGAYSTSVYKRKRGYMDNVAEKSGRKSPTATKLVIMSRVYGGLHSLDWNFLLDDV